MALPTRTDSTREMEDAERACLDEPVVVQRPEPEHEAPAVEVSGHGVEM
ncbi:hypothetical protein [Streptomyces adelaidensis]|nr:hypothetical protein [Streptomyces adelaidensis]